MGINKSVLVGGVAVAAALVVGVATSATAADAPDTRTTSSYVAPNSITGAHVVDGSLWQRDINPAVVSLLRTPGGNSVTSWTVKDGSLYGADINAWWRARFDNSTPNHVGSAQIVDGGVTKDDLAHGSVGMNELNGKVKDKLISGIESDSPYPGATELQDFPGNGANSTVKWVGDSGATLQRAWVMCAEGKTAIGGGYQRADEGVAAFKNIQVVTSAATQIEKQPDGSYAEVYHPIDGDAAGSLVPNAWLVEGFNNGTTDLIMRPSVVCAKIG